MDLNYLYPLRNRLMKRHGNDLEILLSNFEGTTQKIDIERGGTKLVGPYARIKEDVKVFKDPNFNWSDEKAIMNAMADRFDMPSWALYSLECKKELNKRLQKYNDVFFYQTKGCDLHCSYCYVDDFNNNGKLDHGAMYVSLNKILEDFYEEREKRQKLIEEGMKIDSDGKLILECNRLRASGGEPTLVIEQWLELLEKLEKDGMSKEVHLQSDTNLSTGHFIKYLERNGDIPKGILDDVARFPNFSLLASFKGTDPNNFAFNTRSNPKLFEEVFYSFGLYLDAGIDVYPFLYNPNSQTIESFMERLAHEFGDDIYKKTWVFRIRMYDVIKERLTKEAHARGMDPEQYITMRKKGWDENFEKSEVVMKRLLKEKFGLNYKEFLRVGI